MSRLSKKFTELKKKRRKAFIAFMTAGDPTLKKTAELVHEFETQGVDVLELGVPFSDPLADGPVIQAASQRSLARGTTLKKILSLVAQARKKSQMPIVLMSYLNPIWHYGLKRFAADAHRAGVDGLIVPDLPPEEGAEASKLFRAQKLDLIYLLAPTSSAQRQKRVARASRGFVYYVSLTGVTGVRKKLSSQLGVNVRSVKRATRLPVCVGFGVSTPEQAKEVAKDADGVIIGSAIVRALDQYKQLNSSKLAEKVLRPFSRALNKGA